MGNLFFKAILAGVIFSSISTYAGTRKVYFSAVGRVVINTALTAAESAKCVVYLTNRSPVNQNFKIDLSPSSSSGTSPGGLAGNTCPSTASYTSLTAGNSYSCTGTFNAISAANSTQDVTCAGSITVEDATATSGFISANASLVTFYATTPKTATAGSIQTIFTPSNILINGGSPF